MSFLAKYNPRRYLKLLLPLALLLLAIHLAAEACKVDLPGLWESVLKSGEVYGRFLELELEALPRMLEAAAVTILLAALATPIGAVISMLFAVAGARNVSKPWLRIPARLSLGLERSLPDIVALFVLIAAFGIGPFPAVIALALGSLGMLGKLWADQIEEVEPGSMEAIRACGGSLSQALRYAVVPQIMPGLISNTVFRFEVNVRAATVLGGLAGVGIGYELSRSFALLEYGRMGMAVLVIIMVVHLCERLSGFARSKALVGAGLE